MNIQLDETNKSNIIKQLKLINPAIDFIDMKESMDKLKEYIDQMELSINNISTEDKKDKQQAISSILILFRNINEYIKCF
jgi:hypothetical protein